MGQALKKDEAEEITAVKPYEETPDLAQVLFDNTGEVTLRRKDLDRVKFPSAGVTIWEIPSIDGDAETTRILQGVVILRQAHRGMYAPDAEPNEQGVKVPTCASEDMIHGRGDPGDELAEQGKGCADCIFAKWQRKADGNGFEPLPCKVRERLYLLREGDQIPLLIDLPPTSVKIWKDFMKQISLKVKPARPYWQLPVAIKLKSITRGKNTFSVIEPTLDKSITLSNAARVALTKFHNDFDKAMAARIFEDDDDETPRDDEAMFAGGVTANVGDDDI